MRTDECFPVTTFMDIAAVVFYLKVITWAIEDFAVHKYITHLAELHNRIEHEGSVTVKTHRYYLEAQKPA